MSDEKKKVLFVCLGNTCRSPIAECVFQKTVKELGQADQWEIDSAAIADWHVGDPPNWRSLATLKNFDVPYNNNTARQITSADFYHFNYILGMDEHNMWDLSKRAPKESNPKLYLFGDFDPLGDRIIYDPYCDEDFSGFIKCYEQSVRCSKGFLEYLDKDKSQ